MLFKGGNRRAGRILPYRLRKMDVTIPEAGNDGLSSAVNDLRIIRKPDLTAAADRRDDSPGCQNDGVRQRGGVWRGVYAASHQGERLCVSGDAETSRRAKEQKEKRGAEPISDHGRNPLIWRVGDTLGRGQKHDGANDTPSVRLRIDSSCSPLERN